VRLLVHNLGHVMGAPSHRRTADASPSFGARHCTNLCIMRHGATVSDLLRLASEETAAHVTFCRSCQRDVLSLIAATRFSPN
jgi:predicted Zn-dependent protease